MNKWLGAILIIVIGLGAGLTYVYWDDIFGGETTGDCEEDDVCVDPSEEIDLDGEIIPSGSVDTGGTASIANPASVKCEEDGGELKMLEQDEGTAGYCFFEDGSVCEEWAYFDGECELGACQKSCDFADSFSEGWYDCNGKLLYLEACSQLEE